MRISKRAEYALRALFVLARAAPGRPLAIQEIAERENMPVKFVEQILLRLRRGGLLTSKRGVGGGYLLRRDADEITIADVFHALDEAITPLPCNDEGSRDKCTCRDPRTCALRIAMSSVAASTTSILAGTTLREAVDRVPTPERLSFEI